MIAGIWAAILLISSLTILPSRPHRFTSVQTSASSRVVATISVEELKSKLAANESVMIIDVRATNEYIGSDNKIKGAVRVKSRRLRSRLKHPPFKDTPRDRLVVTYCDCQKEETSNRAAIVLLDAGFTNVRSLKGGWSSWLKAGGQVERRPR
jgi:rhodanese-related sulfurtransferase